MEFDDRRLLPQSVLHVRPAADVIRRAGKNLCSSNFYI